jgi:protein-S-isoprenylcysteine O-methyltransferase Ste14
MSGSFSVPLLSTWHVVTLAWLVFVLYWAVSATATARTSKRESIWGRAPQMVLVVLGAVLLFDNNVQIAILNQRFFPRERLLRDAGVALTWLGILFAIWARYHIGQYWSGRVTLKEEHQLIRSGPYARVRHPIYTGLAVAMFGTALVVGEWRGLLGAFLVLIAHVLKARKEESWLTERFGEAYEKYRQETGFLLPRFR